jgi:para-nitrobenzyl esterase
MQFDGEELAREQGLVVVTLDYRLGVLGFLAHRALATANWRLGNQALWDQRLALAWVKKNIAAFGGDPGRVTLFGQAGGARDVCLHMASPESRGLFQRAIGHSSGCTTLQTTGDEAMRSADSFAKQLGCSGEDAVRCLRAKSVGELLAATLAAASFGPVVDGQFLPAQPRDLYAAGDIAKVPYLLGSNSDEGTRLLSDEPVILSESELKAAITRYFSTPAARIAQRYPIARFERSEYPYQAALARILGDAAFVCTTLDTALRASQAGASVYLFNFDVPLTVAGTPLGASHGSELSYVFGSSGSRTESSQRVRERMQTYWAQFAAAGDPNGGDLLEWPRFSASSDQRLNLAASPSIVHDFRADECDFWRATFQNAFTAAIATTH